MTERTEPGPGEAGRAWGVGYWVPIVLVFGLVLGLAEIALWPTHGGPGGPPPRGPATPLAVAETFAILSAVALALLVALEVVYVRTYLETRAQFALGLVAVLLALLFENVASSPFLFAVFGYGPGNLGPFLAVGAALEVGALTLFLALSLE